jgi:hypothetical protein
MSRARRGRILAGPNAPGADILHLGKPRLRREFAKGLSSAVGMVPDVDGGLTLRMVFAGHRGSADGIQGVDRLRFAKLISQEVLWSALAFCCV